MDSLSQAALGATLGVIVMGRHRPVWQSALLGGLVATLPDLDVFIDKGDAVSNMVLHRAETHAYFWQMLASVPIAAGLAWMTQTKQLFLRWWVMVLVLLVTHSMLDSMTVYGTRVWLPFDAQPVGLGSLFIIDPLYTLPLLLGLVFTGLSRQHNRRRWSVFGLLLSTLYAGWSIAAQAYVADKVMQTPEAKGLSEEQVLVTPTPFNTLLWRIVLRHQDTYHEGFYSLFDQADAGQAMIRFIEHDRGGRYEQQTADIPAANQIREFSKGFYALSDDGRQVRITDLRMGQYPYYVFSFVIAEHQSPSIKPIDPLRQSQRMPVGPGLTWLYQRIGNQEVDPL